MATENELRQRIKDLERDIASERQKRAKMQRHVAFVETYYNKATEYLAINAANDKERFEKAEELTVMSHCMHQANMELMETDRLLSGHKAILKQADCAKDTVERISAECDMRMSSHESPEAMREWREQSIIQLEVARQIAKSLATATKPLLELMAKVREERDMFKNKEINLQYYAMEHLIIKAYDEGVRDERPRSLAAAISAMFKQYPKLKPLTTNEVLDFIKANMFDARASLPKVVYPDIVTPKDTAVHQATAELREEYARAGQFLQAQSAHAALVASYCHCKKRSTELFDTSQHFTADGGAHYALRENHGFHPFNTARRLADILVNEPVATSTYSHLSLAATMPEDELYVGGPGEIKQWERGNIKDPKPSREVFALDIAVAKKPAPLLPPPRDMNSKYDVRVEKDYDWSMDKHAKMIARHERIMHSPASYLDVAVPKIRAHVKKDYFDVLLEEIRKAAADPKFMRRA